MALQETLQRNVSVRRAGRSTVMALLYTRSVGPTCLNLRDTSRIELQSQPKRG